MRVRANLTGKEYAKLMEFLRRWNDVPLRTPPPETGPKRLIFSQPINELRPQPQANVAPPAAQPNDGLADALDAAAVKEAVRKSGAEAVIDQADLFTQKPSRQPLNS